MEFNIKKNGVLPVLKLGVVRDGRGEDKDFINFIETSTLFFSMVDVNTGISKIHMEPAGFVEKTFIDPNTPTEYYVYFKFQNKHLNTSGRFEGQFTIKNESGTLVLPIREQLFINIFDSQGYVDSNNVTNLNLTAEVSPGSTIIKYTLSSDNPTPYDTTVTFNHILKVFTGDTLTISTGITLNSLQRTNSFVLTLNDVDFYNLNKISRFSNVDIFPLPINGEMKISEITVFNVPPPSATPTITPTPTPISIYDAILVDAETYIKVGTDTYLRYVDPPLPTPTPTPTQTPTPTVTQTQTQTPTITPSSTPIFIYDAVLVESDIYFSVGSDFYLRFIDPPPPSQTPTQTPTNTQTPTQTPTNTQTPSVTPSQTPVPPTPFISIWNADTTIELPYTPTGLYSGTIDWGDGNISANTYENRTHTYNTTGDYTVTITGQIEGWNFQSYATSYTTNIKEILSWGSLRGENNSNEFMFKGCSNLVLTGVTDSLNLNGVTSLQEMFYGCSSITTVNNMNSWDVSNISNMSSMFNQATFFNQNIGGWNVSSVTNMSFTFSNATNFNQNIEGWNISSVTNMFAMFAGALFFNQNISGWNTSLVTEMFGMFAGASSFNQDLSSWCVTNILSKPTAFDLNATSWVLPQPVWGTCPGPIPSPTPTPTQTPTITQTNTQTPSITPTIPITCNSFTFNSINANTTINSAIKTTGGGWDSSAYSVGTYTNPLYVTFNMSSTNIGAMGGFSFNPTLSLSTYENATFGLYCENGNLKIYENGNNVYTVFNGGTITPSDLFKVEYDGTVVNYYYNGSLVYTSLQAITQPLHIFFPLLTQNEGVINVCVIETPLPTPTVTPTNSQTPTLTPTPSFTPNCVRQIVVPTLWNGGTSINTNTLQLTKNSETLQIRVNDVITDFNGSTSFVGIVSSDSTYTYVFTGPGGGVSFDCQFPLTFSGSC